MAHHSNTIPIVEDESGPDSIGEEDFYNIEHADQGYFPDFQHLNGDLDSPNDMQVDSEEFLNSADMEKNDDEVAEINPDGPEGPLANDCMYLPWMQWNSG